jgi:response regulator of citrate/malate metabolism
MKQKTLDKIWNTLKQRPGASVGQLAARCGLSYTTTKKYVLWMTEEGCLYYTEERYRNTVNTRLYFINFGYVRCEVPLIQ